MPLVLNPLLVTNDIASWAISLSGRTISCSQYLLADLSRLLTDHQPCLGIEEPSMFDCAYIKIDHAQLSMFLRM